MLRHVSMETPALLARNGFDRIAMQFAVKLDETVEAIGEELGDFISYIFFYISNPDLLSAEFGFPLGFNCIVDNELSRVFATGRLYINKQGQLALGQLYRGESDNPPELFSGETEKVIQSLSIAILDELRSELTTSS